MHLTKRILLLSAASISFAPAYAEDNPTEAQTKAVQVLRQKTAELDRRAVAPAPVPENPEVRRRSAEALRRKQADLDRITPGHGNNAAPASRRAIPASSLRAARSEVILLAAADETETSEIQRKAIEALRKAEADLRTEEERVKAARAKPESGTMSESDKKKDNLLSSPRDRSSQTDQSARGNRPRRADRTPRETTAAPPMDTSVDLTSDPNRDVHEKALEVLHQKESELDGNRAVAMPPPVRSETSTATSEVRMPPAEVDHSEVHEKALQTLHQEKPTSARRPATARVLTPPMLKARVLEPGMPPSQVQPREPRTNSPPLYPQPAPVPPGAARPAVSSGEPLSQAAPAASSAAGPRTGSPVEVPYAQAARQGYARSSSSTVSAQEPDHSEVHRIALQVLRQKELDLASEKTSIAQPKPYTPRHESIVAADTFAPNPPTARPWDDRPAPRIAPRMQPSPAPAQAEPRISRRIVPRATPEPEPVVSRPNTDSPDLGGSFYQRAFEALHDKYLELNFAPPAPAVVRSEREVAPQRDENARRALREKTDELQPVQPVVATRPAPDRSRASERASDRPAPAPAPAALARDAVTPPKNSPVIENPSIAPGKTKEEKLADLLELYKADKVTPRQYQEERRKILFAP